MTDYTVEDKVEKFDDIIVRYNELVAYRQNLAITAISGYEFFITEEEESGGVIFKKTDKIIRLESLIKIQIEIDRIDTILSFIESILNKL